MKKMKTMNENDPKSNQKGIYYYSFDVNLKNNLNIKSLLDLISNMKEKEKMIIDIQTIKPHVFLNKNHLNSAIWHSYKAISTSKSLSDSLSIEFLLYSTGQRQIKKAIDYFGLKGKFESFTIVFFLKTDLKEEYLKSILNTYFTPLSINEVEFIKDTNDLKYLYVVFNYEENLNGSDKDHFESYLLSTISNLVFEV